MKDISDFYININNPYYKLNPQLVKFTFHVISLLRSLRGSNPLGAFATICFPGIPITVLARLHMYRLEGI